MRHFIQTDETAWAFSRQARKKYLYVGEEVKVITEGQGYYHHTLAFTIPPDGTNYNEQIIADGYSCLYKYRGHKSKQLSWTEWKSLNRLLDTAKRKKLGLWSKYPKIMQCLCE